MRVEDGVRYWTHVEIQSLVGYPLLEAKVKIWIQQVNFLNGTIIPDPSIVDKVVKVLNGEKIGPKTYVIDVGTIPPGQIKKVLLNFWCSQPVKFRFWFSVCSLSA